MYTVMALLTGFLITVMVSINGNLTLAYGVFFSAVIIHLVGTLFALIIRKIKKDHTVLWHQGPIWIYLGGLIGTFTTLFNNSAYGYINVTAIVALQLLGQELTALCIDTFSLFHMQKRPFKISTIFGLLFSIFGIYIMVKGVDTSQLTAILFSLASGITIVLSRTVNSKLSERVGPLNGSYINHLTGLPVTCLYALLAWKSVYSFDLSGAAHPWIYIGGMIGVTVVLLYNILVPHLPAFRLTLLSFTGQISTSILIDLFVLGQSDLTTFYGSIFIAAGVLFSTIADHFFQRKTDHASVQAQ